jgi:hypothetical protein
MTARHEQPATVLMQQFWSAQRSRGEKPRTVLGLVPLSQQEPCQPVAWGVLRSYVEMIQARQTKPDDFEIREFYPDQQVTA